MATSAAEVGDALAARPGLAATVRNTLKHFDLRPDPAELRGLRARPAGHHPFMSKGTWNWS